MNVEVSRCEFQHLDHPWSLLHSRGGLPPDDDEDGGSPIFSTSVEVNRLYPDRQTEG